MVNSEHDMHPDFGRVPGSRGVPSIVTIASVIGLAIVFAIGGFVAFSSGYGHHWPITKNLRVDLGSKPST